MIRLNCREEKIIYNALNITKAFFPKESVKLINWENQNCDTNFELENNSSTAIAGNSIRLEIIIECPINDTQIKASNVLTAASGSSPINDTIKKPRIITADNARDLYEKLSEATGRELPWGMLTGVRPVHLAGAWIDQNPEGSAEEFTKWFYEDRFVSREKAERAYGIAKLQREVLNRIPHSNNEVLNRTTHLYNEADGPRAFSLYVGIPFCPTVCSYCSFSSGAISDYADKVELYLDKLIFEIQSTLRMMEGHTITSVYMGGGTPTSLSTAQLERLLQNLTDAISASSPVKPLEFTVEAGRPDSICREKLEVFKEFGVDRISINPQTMQQKTLDLIGRRHTVEDVIQKFHLAREMDFENINMDLIMGLPGETIDDAEKTLAQIEKLNPESLTVHSLAIKRTARMEQLETPFETVVRQLELAADTAARLGMNPYYLYRQKNIAGNSENTGYAKPGMESLYNILIMEELQSIAACGAGASSKVVLPEAVEGGGRSGNHLGNVKRCENVSNVEAYIARIDEMIERKRRLFEV